MLELVAETVCGVLGDKLSWTRSWAIFSSWCIFGLPFALRVWRPISKKEWVMMCCSLCSCVFTMNSSSWRYVACLVHIYNLLSGFYLRCISTSVPVKNFFWNFWVELSSFKYFLFSEKPLSLSGTALHRSSMKPSDMSAILGTGGKSPLILPNSGLFGSLSMVRWLEHLFLFCPCAI